MLASDMALIARAMIARYGEEAPAVAERNAESGRRIRSRRRVRESAHWWGSLIAAIRELQKIEAAA